MYLKNSYLVLCLLFGLACQNKPPLGSELSLNQIVRHLGIDTTGFASTNDTIYWDDEFVEERVYRALDEKLAAQVVITKVHRVDSCDDKMLRERILLESKSLRQTSCNPESMLTVDSVKVEGVRYYITRCSQYTIALACSNRNLVAVNAFGVQLCPIIDASK